MANGPASSRDALAHLMLRRSQLEVRFWSNAILSKSRVVVLKHDLLPHEAAGHRVFHFSTDNLQAGAAIGTHPGSSRPLVLSVGADATAFINGLARPGITSQFNDLL